MARYLFDTRTCPAFRTSHLLSRPLRRDRFVRGRLWAPCRTAAQSFASPSPLPALVSLELNGRTELRPRGTPGWRPEPRTEPVAERRGGSPAVAAPATAPDHPVRGRRRTRWIRPGWRCIIIPLAIPIAAPFQDISQHVAEAPAVWLLLANGVSLTSGVAVVPRILTQFVRVIAEGIQGRTPCPAGEFPFRFGRKPIAVTLDDGDIDLRQSDRTASGSPSR